jgi:hypothetical protein
MTPASGTAKQVGAAPVTVVPTACDLVLWLIPRMNEFPRALRPVLGERTPAAFRSERQMSTIGSRPGSGQSEHDESPCGRPMANALRPALLMEVEYRAQ